MLPHRAALSPASRTLNYLADVLRRHHTAIRATQCRLGPAGQTLLVLVCLRIGKHRRYGRNLRVLSTPDGSLIWVCGSLPGAVHERREVSRGQRDRAATVLTISA